MSIKKPLLCKICGSNDIIEKNGKWFCQACETYYSKDEFSAEDIKQIAAQNQAETYLRYSVPRFEDAREQFEILCNDYPNMSSPYWGLLRAKYGIKYQIDGSNAVPTPYSDSYEDIRRDPLFEKCLKLAESDDLRKKYESEAKRIAVVSKEWMEKAKKHDYDIFLSFKDDKGTDTLYVRELYDSLKEKGYKVFYSPISMKKYIGQPCFDAYIFNAINKAKVLIVYGSKAEYFTSTWVQNEWTRYIKLMEIKQKSRDSLIVAYKNINPSIDLPVQLSNRQALDCNSLRPFDTIYKKIKSIISLGNQDADMTDKDKYEYEKWKADTEEKKRIKAEERAEEAAAKAKKYEDIANTRNYKDRERLLKQQKKHEENERRKRELRDKNEIRKFIDVDCIYNLQKDTLGQWYLSSSAQSIPLKHFENEAEAKRFYKTLLDLQAKMFSSSNISFGKNIFRKNYEYVYAKEEIKGLTKHCVYIIREGKNRKLYKSFNNYENAQKCLDQLTNAKGSTVYKVNSLKYGTSVLLSFIIVLTSLCLCIFNSISLSLFRTSNWLPPVNVLSVFVVIGISVALDLLILPKYIPPKSSFGRIYFMLYGSHIIILPLFQTINLIIGNFYGNITTLILSSIIFLFILTVSCSMLKLFDHDNSINNLLIPFCVILNVAITVAKFVTTGSLFALFLIVFILQMILFFILRKFANPFKIYSPFLTNLLLICISIHPYVLSVVFYPHTNDPYANTDTGYICLLLFGITLIIAWFLIGYISDKWNNYWNKRK